MCFKPSMIFYTLSLSNIPFFNIIPNGEEHIHQKKKCYITHSILMKMQPYLCLYQNISFLFEEVFKLCSFNDQKHI
jgi:hypothetical protein